MKDRIRAYQHVPVGVLAAWLCYELPLVGIPFFCGFFLYEYIQDWRKVDHSYKDIIGFLWGFGAIAAILAALSLSGIIGG